MSVTIATSRSVDPRTRGFELGRQLRDEIARTWESYARLFALHGIDEATVRSVALSSADAASAWSPVHADELFAVAAGAGLAEWQGAALNSRSEVLTHSRLQYPGECSTVAYLPEPGPPLTVQTWDWQHELAGVKLIWRYEARPGWSVKTFTEFGVLGKVGVNSAGVGVHFNLLQHQSDGHPGGVPVHIVARRLLDEAATLDDVRSIVMSASVTASVALTVVAPHGDRFDGRIFELSPSGVAELMPDASGYLLHTNHFVDPTLAQGERLGVDDPDTYARLAALEARRESLGVPAFSERVAALVHHREDGAAICCHPEPGSIEGDRWSTHLVIGLDVERGRITFHDGAPCTASEAGMIQL